MQISIQTLGSVLQNAHFFLSKFNSKSQNKKIIFANILENHLFCTIILLQLWKKLP